MSDSVVPAPPPGSADPARATRATRWQRLVDAGIATGPLPDDASHAPWHIAAMTGAAAWLAALFLLFFLGIALEDVVKRAPGAIAVGGVVVAAAVAVLRFAAQRPFVAQLALAFSLAGQAMLLVGLLMNDGRPRADSFLVFALIEAALVVVVHHAAHRVLATLACGVSVLVALDILGLDPLVLPAAFAAFVVVQSRVIQWSPRHAMLVPVAYGLALVMLCTFVYGALPEIHSLFAGKVQQTNALRFVATALVAVTSAAAGVIVAQRAGGARGVRLAAAGALALLAIAAYAVPAVAASSVMLLMAYAARQRALATIAVLAMIASLAAHYYRLDTTLLAKSASLAAIAAVLLVAYVVVRRWPRAGGVDAA